MIYKFFKKLYYKKLVKEWNDEYGQYLKIFHNLNLARQQVDYLRKFEKNLYEESVFMLLTIFEFYSFSDIKIEKIKKLSESKDFNEKESKCIMSIAKRIKKLKVQ